MFKNKDTATPNSDDTISTSSELPPGTCGGCGSTENVVNQCCSDCSSFTLDELTPSEQDVLDAMEYANNWIW